MKIIDLPGSLRKMLEWLLLREQVLEYWWRHSKKCRIHEDREEFAILDYLGLSWSTLELQLIGKEGQQQTK